MPCSGKPAIPRQASEASNWTACSRGTLRSLCSQDRATTAKRNIVIGLVLMTTVLVADHRWVRIAAPVAYAASVLGLVLVLVAGSTINGSRSWIVVGGMSIQPAELAKLAVVIGMALVLAHRSASRRTHRTGLVDVSLMLAIAAVPAE